jgi:hypothetical protein
MTLFQSQLPVCWSSRRALHAILVSCRILLPRGPVFEQTYDPMPLNGAIFLRNRAGPRSSALVRLVRFIALFTCSEGFNTHIAIGSVDLIH